MITDKMIAVYKKFNGDIDDWARMGTADDKLTVSDKDWFMIDNFLQGFTWIKTGLASESFVDTLTMELSMFIDSKSTIKMLKTMVKV